MRKITLFLALLGFWGIAHADDFILGRTYTRHPRIWDFKFDGTLNLVYMRSLFLYEIGDTVDLAIGRAGPDNAHFGDRPEPTEAGTSLGALYWVGCGVPVDPVAVNALGRGCEFNLREHLDFPHPDDPPGVLRQGVARNAQINVRAVGNQTSTSRSGEMYFAVTPVNAVMPENAFKIRNNRLLRIYHPGLNCLVDVEFGDPGSCGGGKRCLMVADVCAE